MNHREFEELVRSAPTIDLSYKEAAKVVEHWMEGVADELKRDLFATIYLTIYPGASAPEGMTRDEYTQLRADVVRLMRAFKAAHQTKLKDPRTAELVRHCDSI